MMTSLTRESTNNLPKVAPMMMPAAMSTMLPLMANSLSSISMLMSFSLIGKWNVPIRVTAGLDDVNAAQGARESGEGNATGGGAESFILYSVDVFAVRE
jgi:hypothetical protein